MERLTRQFEQNQLNDSRHLDDDAGFVRDDEKP